MSDRAKLKPPVRQKSRPVELTRAEVFDLVYDAIITIENIVNVAQDKDRTVPSDSDVRTLLHTMKEVARKANRARELLETLLDAEVADDCAAKGGGHGE